jgi:phage terminase small subunit
VTRGFKATLKPTLARVSEKIREAPNAPAGFSRDAADVWNQTAPALAKAGMLHAALLGALEAYCIAVGLIRACDRSIGKEGAFHKQDGKIRPHPGVAIIAEQTRAVRVLASHLGIAERREKGSGLRPSSEDEDDGLGDL